MIRNYLHKDYYVSSVATAPTVGFVKRRSSTHKKHSKQVQKIKELSKFGGLIVLDAHQNALDIFASCLSVRKHEGVEKIIFPVTAYDYYFPVWSMFLTKMHKDKIMKVYPVFRSEEYENNKWNYIKKPFFPGDKNPKDLNNLYVSHSKSAVKKSGNVVLVSPYGGVKPLGSSVKRGVVELLQTGAPAICTWSKFNFRNLRFETALSNPIYFNKNSASDYVQKVITSKFKDISHRN